MFYMLFLSVLLRYIFMVYTPRWDYNKLYFTWLWKQSCDIFLMGFVNQDYPGVLLRPFLYLHH